MLKSQELAGQGRVGHVERGMAMVAFGDAAAASPGHVGRPAMHGATGPSARAGQAFASFREVRASQVVYGGPGELARLAPTPSDVGARTSRARPRR